MAYTYYGNANKDFENATVIDGVVRWTSNNRVPPTEYVEAFLTAGLITTEVANASEDARNADLTAFLADYAQAQAERTPEQIAEERFEARAAIGEGVEMVNVFTGERYTT